MAFAEHPITPEDVQAFVDGELTAERAAMARAHLDRCAECRKTADDMTHVSRAMGGWQVETAPASVRVPFMHGTASAPRFWTQWNWQVAAAITLVVGLAWLGRPTRGVSGSSSAKLSSSPEMAQGVEFLRRPVPIAQSPMPRAAPQDVSNVGAQGRASDSMIARTAMLTMVVANVADARTKLDATLAEVGGLVGHVELVGGREHAPRLTATVRVPSDRLAAALVALKTLGTVVTESLGSEDVTAQTVDLDARLGNARETERRLVQVLQQRTGKVSDVLEVEREIARVRESIERMSAERASLGRRVTYATITLEVSEEKRAALNLDRPSVSRDLRNAFVDGLKTASQSALGAAALLMRIAPSVVLWAAILAWPAVALRRRIKAPSQGS